MRYAALAIPLDATGFITGLKTRMQATLDKLNTGLTAGSTGGVRIITRAGKPWVSVPKLDKLPEPKNLGKLKAEVQRWWGTIDLLDILKKPPSSPTSPTPSPRWPPASCWAGRP